MRGKYGTFKPIRIFKFHVILCCNQFLHFSHHFFFSIFGLFTIVQGPVKPRSRFCRGFSRLFCIFPIKICLLISSLHVDWSNTTERFVYSTISVATSGNDIVTTSFLMRSRIVLLPNKWAACEIFGFLGAFSNMYQWAYGRGPLCWICVRWRMWRVIGWQGTQFGKDWIVLEMACQIVVLSVLWYYLGCCMQILVANVSPWLLLLAVCLCSIPSPSQIRGTAFLAATKSL